MPVTGHDDDAIFEDLVRRVRAGDRNALEDLLARIRPLALARCRAFFPCTADAEDAAQDALLAISTKLGQYSGHGSFRGWVTAVSSNSARGTYRSMRRRAVERSDGELPHTADPRTTSVIAGTRLDLLDALESLEARAPAVVEPFVLRDLGGLSYEEIAAQTGLASATVKDRIHRARTYLRGVLPR